MTIVCRRDELERRCSNRRAASLVSSGSLVPNRLSARVVLALLFWSSASSLLNYPHCLAYFNEASGGAKFGGHNLLSSNIDWGQDLLLLKELIRDEHVYLAYFGCIDPSVVGLEYSPAPFSRLGVSGSTPPGLYAISVTFLYGQSWQLRGARHGRVVVPYHAYSDFVSRCPTARAGHSIMVYRVGTSVP